MFRHKLIHRAVMAAMLASTIPNLSWGHTNAIGYVGSGGGAATFWYGNWHPGTNFNEGELKLEGVNGTSFAPTITRFNLLSSTLPTGLVSGTNYFSSDGTTLVAYNASSQAGSTYTWQGARFTGLSAGTYRFTYIPLGDPQSYCPSCSPTANWRPMDNIILSSTLTLDAATLGGGTTYSEIVATARQTPATGVAGTLDGVAAAPASAPGLAPVITALGNLGNNQQVAQAVAQLLPVLTTGSAQATINIAQTGPTKILIDRMFRLNGLASGDETPQDRKLWIKPFGTKTDQGNHSGVSGFSASGAGLVVGADARVNPDWRVGLAVSYGATSISGKTQLPSGVGTKTGQLTAYGTRRLDDDTYVNLLGALGYNTNDSHRQISFGGIDYTAKGSYNGWHSYAEADLTKTFSLTDSTTIMPSVRAYYTYASVDGYTESGSGPANLKVGSAHEDSLVVMTGAKLVHALTDSIRVTGHLDAGYDTMAKRNQVTSSFTEGGATFVTKGIEPEKSIYRGGVALELLNKDGMEITVAYDLETRRSYKDETAFVNVRVPF